MEDDDFGIFSSSGLLKEVDFSSCTLGVPVDDSEVSWRLGVCSFIMLGRAASYVVLVVIGVVACFVCSWAADVGLDCSGGLRDSSRAEG